MSVFQRAGNRVQAVFTVRGRANRTHFIALTLLYGAIYAIADFNFHSDLQFLVALALFWPVILITGRRLHDIEMSAWWVLIALIPYVGLFFTLYLMAKKGSVGENLYGMPSVINSRAESNYAQWSN